jgi:hypothetical protein
MKPFTQVEVLRFWFEDHDTINLAQAKAGLPAPDPSFPPVRVERVAPLIHQLRNEGWVIVTFNDDAGVAHYRVVSKPGIPGPGHPERVTKVKEDDPTKADPRWECSKVGCMSGVRPDVTTTFDSRYTTGKCFTHGKVVLVRR